MGLDAQQSATHLDVTLLAKTQQDRQVEVPARNVVEIPKTSQDASRRLFRCESCPNLIVSQFIDVLAVANEC